MGLFKRMGGTPEDFNDPSLGDAAWLNAGEDRYRSLVSKHYGSPDTIAAGGDQRVKAGDQAGALFFYQKAIDTLQHLRVRLL